MAFFNNLSFGFFGASVEEMEEEQEIDEEIMTEIFSNPFTTKEEKEEEIERTMENRNLKLMDKFFIKQEEIEKERKTYEERENLKQEWQRQIEEFQKKERTAKQSGDDGPGPGISGPSLGIGPISEQTFGVFGLDTGDYDGNPPSEDPGGDGSPGDGSPAGAGGGDPAGTPW